MAEPKTGLPNAGSSRFDDVCSDRRVVLLPDAAFDPADIHYAAVWKPAPGELAAFPNLRVIFNLGAGVDALMADSSLPNVPLVRVAVGDLTARMTRICRTSRADASSAGALPASQPAREALGAEDFNGRRARFRSASWAWARSGPTRPAPSGTSAFACRAGAEARNRSTASNAFTATAQLDAFLQRTDILVCLLPLTADTRHILNRGLFAKLNRNSPIGAPVVINAGRGGLQNEADILQCLDDGTLGAVSLDVFAD